MWLRIALAVAIVTSIASDGVAQPANGLHKVDAVLRRHIDRDSGGSVEVIVRTRPGTTSAVQRRLAASGHKIRKHHALIGAVTAEVKTRDLAALAANASILSISVDAEVAAQAFPARDRQTANLEKVYTANELRSTLGAPADAIGAGIGVAVIDSGIAPIGDFAHIVEFRDFTRGGVPVQPFDDYGHGTHVAGLIASTGELSTFTYVGVAPGVRLIGLKVLDQEGRGVVSDVISALEFAALNRTRLGIDVINLSLGHPIYQRAADDPLVQAVEQTVRAGIAVVVSAGNYGQNPETKEIGYGGITSPGNAPSAITVGCEKTEGTVTRLDDSVAKYSSRGPAWFDGLAKPDVVAPGQDLISDIPRNSTLYKRFWRSEYLKDGRFLELSGSSMATAVTTGVVALALEANRNEKLYRDGLLRPATFDAYIGWSSALFPYLSWVRPLLPPNAVKGILQYTAFPLSPSGTPLDALTQGTGGVNAAGAIRVAKAVDPTRPAGTQWIAAPLTDRWSFVGGAALDWSQSIIWNNVLMSGNLLDVNQPAWALNIVWGTDAYCENGSETCDNIVWGTLSDDESSDNIVWGTFDENGDNIVWGTSDENGDNIVWGTFDLEDQDNIVWGTNVVFGAAGTWVTNIVWGTGLVSMSEENSDNIVWGTNDDGDNIVWGTYWLSFDGTISVAGLGGGF